MKHANSTKDDLQEEINDEMEGMDEIIHKISQRARSHFEQTSLFPVSAVSAIQDIEHEGRKRRREQERKKANPLSPNQLPSPEQVKIGPLVPTPSAPTEIPYHRQLLVVLVAVLVLYILQRTFPGRIFNKGE